MKLIANAFEMPITEEFNWLTDIITSDDGTEQRISLLDPPVRTLAPTYNFTTEEDARRLVRTMFMAQTGYQVPCFHLAAKVAPAAAGALSLAFDPLKTELRDGATAALIDRVSGAVTIVALGAVTEAGAALLAPLPAAALRSSIAPVWAMFGSDNASLSRGNPNDVISTTISLRSLDFIDPFLNPFNTSTLDLFEGLPLLPFNAVGTNFDVAFNNGSTLIDYGAATTIRSRWNHAQMQFARDYLCQRISNPAQWYLWQKFIDYCKGSANPFYLPTYRPDFGIVGIAFESTLTLKGLDYGEEFFPFQAFKQFAIFTEAGRHNTSVTAVAAIGGNTVCTIDPPLPNAPGYANSQIASLLLRCRIADDKVSFAHDATFTTVTLNIRTTDQ